MDPAHESGPNHDGERSRLEPNHHNKGGPLMMAMQMVSLSQLRGNCSAALCALATEGHQSHQTLVRICSSLHAIPGLAQDRLKSCWQD